MRNFGSELLMAAAAFLTVLLSVYALKECLSCILSLSLSLLYCFHFWTWVCFLLCKGREYMSLKDV